MTTNSRQILKRGDTGYFSLLCKSSGRWLGLRAFQLYSRSNVRSRKNNNATTAEISSPLGPLRKMLKDKRYYPRNRRFLGTSGSSKCRKNFKFSTTAATPRSVKCIHQATTPVIWPQKQMFFSVESESEPGQALD